MSPTYEARPRSAGGPRKLSATEAKGQAERDRLDLVIDSVAVPVLVTDSSGDLVMMKLLAERLFSGAGDTCQAKNQRVHASNTSSPRSCRTYLLRRRQDSRSCHGGVQPRRAQAVQAGKDRGRVERSLRQLRRGRSNHRRPSRRDRSHQGRSRLQQVKAASRAALAAGPGGRRRHFAHRARLLRQQAVELERASITKSQFLANVSIDVGRHLNAVLGCTEPAATQRIRPADEKHSEKPRPRRR